MYILIRMTTYLLYWVWPLHTWFWNKRRKQEINWNASLKCNGILRYDVLLWCFICLLFQLNVYECPTNSAAKYRIEEQ